MDEQKVLVLYKSKYGATRKYANMLQSQLNCDVVDLGQQQPSDFQPYDVIVLAGALYASGIAGIGFLRKNLYKVQLKKVAILCVGASPYDEEAMEQMKAKNLKEDLKHIPVFYARGAWDESKMTLKDRVLCGMLRRFIQKRDPNTYEPWMRAFAQSMGKQCDWVDVAYLEPLVAYIQQ